MIQLEMPIELIQRHGIFHHEKPENLLLRCLNPEHNDHSPSMQVHRETGMFNCFSCGFKGTYRDLRRILGEEDTASDDILFKASTLIRKLNNSYKGHEATSVEPPTNVVPMPNDFRKIDKETIKAFGAFTSNNEDFAHRLWFPIEHFGRIIGYQGRATEDGLNPKYKFYPKNLYLKPVLYGIETVENKTVVLVEGLFDMLNLRDKGIKEACCIFGSNLGLEKIYTLLTYDIKQVVLMFDPDTSGLSATSKTLKLFQQKAKQIAIDAVYLPGPEDPGELTQVQVDKLLQQEPLKTFLRRNI